MRAQLIPVEGGEPIDLVRDLTLVGRKEDCDLRLDHKSVSKIHCILIKTDGLLLLRDLGSTNGTRVNGQRVRRAALLPNDQVAFANYKYRVSLSLDDALEPVGDLTQQMNAREVAQLLRKDKAPAAADVGDALSSLPLQPNLLPDLYPDKDANPPA
jgi:pSer/pThr/pTyr-binding forkhead associated (FHA) protein